LLIDSGAAPATTTVEVDEMANALIARPVPKISAIALINVSGGMIVDASKSGVKSNSTHHQYEWATVVNITQQQQ
jgi:hypothetical protein